MDELILFDDVEGILRETFEVQLRNRMPGVESVNDIPNPRPKEFLRTIRTGGPRETLVTERAQISLEGWAQTKERAIAILNLGRAILNAQEGMIFGVTEYGGPVNLPDEISNQVRYTQTFGVRARGTVIA